MVYCGKVVCLLEGIKRGRWNSPEENSYHPQGPARGRPSRNLDTGRGSPEAKASAEWLPPLWRVLLDPCQKTSPPSSLGRPFRDVSVS